MGRVISKGEKHLIHLPLSEIMSNVSAALVLLEKDELKMVRGKLLKIRNASSDADSLIGWILDIRSKYENPPESK